MRDRVTISLLAASLLVMTGSQSVAFDQWPDTGQTLCYDSAGGEVNCDGSEGFAGQDGFYDGPARDYDTTTEADTVIDNVTMLQWDNTDPAQAAPTVYTGAEGYVAALNISSPHADWRIPTVQELATIIDASEQPWDHISGVYGPFVMPTTTPGNDAIYWSATDSPASTGYWMVVRFKQGLVNDGHNGADFGDVAYVRPVRDVTP